MPCVRLKNNPYDYFVNILRTSKTTFYSVALLVSCVRLENIPFGCFVSILRKLRITCHQLFRLYLAYVYDYI